MMESRRVLCVASYMRDVSLEVVDFPLAGETVASLSRVEGHGGKGSNQAVQAARCGAAVTVVASVGDDPHGRAALSLWRAETIDTAAVALCPHVGTGLAMIVVNRHGENQIVIDPGANAFLTDEAVGGAVLHASAVALVIAQLEIPPSTIVAGFSAARARGAATLLNVAPAVRALPPGLAGLIDILVANEIEGANLACLPVDSDPQAIGSALLKQAARAVVLTLGARGAMAFGADGSIHAVPALPVTVRDTTGAGDAFVGALAAEYATHGNLKEALGLAVVAGSAACRERGAVASFAGREELLTIQAAHASAN
jgi:ribokinase